jgi:hypothetical protein
MEHVFSCEFMIFIDNMAMPIFRLNFLVAVSPCLSAGCRLPQSRFVQYVVFQKIVIAAGNGIIMTAR